MLKQLFIGLCICIGALFCTPAVNAEVTSPQPGYILISDRIEVEDFGQFMNATFDTTVMEYEILIHSQGGNAFSTIGIMNRMRELQAHGVKFTTLVYGLGMSGGTYIFMMGDKRIVFSDSTLMLHGTLCQMTKFQREELRSNDPTGYAMLARIDRVLGKRLKIITGWTDAVVEYWMNGGTAQFMSAETAYNTGLATHYVDTY